jgi:hypothetical protein
LRETALLAAIEGEIVLIYPYPRPKPSEKLFPLKNERID